jgi:hypothetical protein
MSSILATLRHSRAIPYANRHRVNHWSSIDSILRAAQVVPDQGVCIFATNALIGLLGDAISCCYG